MQVKDKTWKWTEITLNAEPQIGGGCVLAFLLSDVNVRMERQQRLNSTFAHLLDIMNNTPGGIVVFETLNNRISGLSFASQGMERLLRGTREEIRAAYKNDPYGCVHPDDRSNLIHTIEDWRDDDDGAADRLSALRRLPQGKKHEQSIHKKTRLSRS